MAWVRCCGGSAKKNTILFKDGTFGTTYVNPGSYIRELATYTTGFTVGTNLTTQFPAGKYYDVIGLMNIDFTDINTITIKFTAASTNWNVFIGAQSSGEIAGMTVLFGGQTGTDVTVNIPASSYTGTLNLVLYASGGSNLVVTEISYS